jgi:glucose uptake protein
LAIPTTASSAQLLLILSFLLLGLWSSTFKMAGNRWRFELFSVDFALGAILLALVSAYTLGAFGADLGFSEHMMISSKTNQALAFFAGGVFALGNILLLAGIMLLGLSFAYSFATASALLVLGGMEFVGFRALLLAVVIVAAVLTIIFNAIGAHSAEATLPAASLPVMVRVRKSVSGRSTSGKAPQVTQSMQNSAKGMIASIIGGLALGASLYPLNTSLFGQFGLGTFGGVVVFFSGALAATLVLSFLLMNIPIHGGPTTAKNYLRGSIGQHVLGFVGGAFCAAGVLLLTILAAFPIETRPDPLWLWAAGLSGGLLAIALGLSKWRELSHAAGSAVRSLMVGAFLLVVAIGMFAMAMDKIAPLATAQ